MICYLNTHLRISCQIDKVGPSSVMNVSVKRLNNRVYNATSRHDCIFHFNTGSIPSFCHIISGSNNSLVNLHQVKTLLSNIVTSHYCLIYRDILATRNLVEFNSVDHVWISVIDIKSRKRVPQYYQLIFRIVPLIGCILNFLGGVCSRRRYTL